MKGTIFVLTLALLSTSVTAARAQDEERVAGDDSKEVRIEELIRNLGARDYAVRKKAKRELARMGAPAIPALKNATRSEDLEVADNAREVLARIQKNTRADRPRPPQPRRDTPAPLTRDALRRMPPEFRKVVEDMQRDLRRIQRQFGIPLPGQPRTPKDGAKDDPFPRPGDLDRFFEELFKGRRGQTPAQRENPSPETTPGNAPKPEGNPQEERGGVDQGPFGNFRSFFRGGFGPGGQRSMTLSANGESMTMREDQDGYHVTITTREGGRTVTKTYEAENEEQFKAKFPKIYEKVQGGDGPLRFRFFSGPPGAMPNMPDPFRDFFGPGEDEPQPEPDLAPVAPSPGSGIAGGAELSKPDAALRKNLDIEDGVGLVVERYAGAHSLLKRAGIEPFDVILSAGGQSIGSVNDLRAVIDSTPDGEDIVFEIISRGERKTCSAAK